MTETRTIYTRVIEQIYEDQYGRVSIEFIPSASHEVANCHFAKFAIHRSAELRGEEVGCSDEECGVIFKAQPTDSRGFQVISDFVSGIKARYQVTIQDDSKNTCEL